MSVALDEQGCRRLLEEVDTFIFDCDGVLWSGAVPIEGSIETLAALHADGKRLFFVTNNSTKSRAFYVRKLQGKGLAFVTENDILNSSYAAAELLKNDPNFKGEVFVIGENGVYEELANVGIKVANAHGECLAYQGPTPQPLWSEVPTALHHPELEENVGAVLVGFDRYLNYTKISKAMLYLQKPECLFYATNTDMTFPTAHGLMPGSGSILACISACSGREPVVCGKPSSHLMEVIKLRAAIDPARTVMVGDRLDTDIVFGNSNGTKTLLVYTGVTTPAMMEKPDLVAVPDYTATALRQLLPALQKK